MEKMKHGLSTFLQWLFGIMFVLVALSIFSESNVTGYGNVVLLLFFAFGCFCIPPIRGWIIIIFTEFGLLSNNKKEFKKEMIEALKDGVLTKEKSDNLARKAYELDVPKEYLDKLRREDFEKRIKPIVTDIEETRRLSPSNEAELKKIARNLQITSEMGENFQMFRDLWKYENEGTFLLRSINVPILLRSREECYFTVPTVWQQNKTITERRGYAGASIGFRVARGVHFSVGRAVPVSKQYEAIQPVSEGEIYITNKKIVFNGEKKSTSITMGRVIQVEIYSDAVEIRKTSGKPDYFMMDGAHAEYFAAIIHKIINN